MSGAYPVHAHALMKPSGQPGGGLKDQVTQGGRIVWLSLVGEVRNADVWDIRSVRGILRRSNGGSKRTSGCSWLYLVGL